MNAADFRIGEGEHRNKVFERRGGRTVEVTSEEMRKRAIDEVAASGSA